MLTVAVQTGSGNVASGQQSDHLLMAAAYKGWSEATAKVCSLAACLSAVPCPCHLLDCLSRVAFLACAEPALRIVEGHDNLQPCILQGGKREGAAYARKHMLSQQTLEMLADMRWQFGAMLADSKFVAAPSGGRGASAKRQAWLDDPLQPWNKQAGQAPLVKHIPVLTCMRLHHLHCEVSN